MQKKPRVIRGGSWNNNARRARSANRNANQPGNANNNLGFRFCLSSMSNALWSQRASWTRPRVPFDWGSSRSTNLKAPGVWVG
uniref:SUMF1/EgtB/PvdO family nonheme iron enzyme n=1 Tax=Methylomonas lenta TaxID=980561 RepID=UPI0012F699C3